jgi:hypothetical protein
MSARETRRILGEGNQVLATAEYLDEKLDGVSRMYGPNGTLHQEMHYSRRPAPRFLSHLVGKRQS